MTTQTNNAPIILALEGMVSADTVYQNASDALREAVQRAADLGIKAVDLEGKPKGKWFNEAQALLAKARLSPEELALWNDKSVKQAIGTPKHAIAGKLNVALKRIRDRLLELETAAMESVLDSRNGEQPEKAKVGATKAGQGAARPLAKRIADEMAKLATASERDRDGKEPSELPHEVFIAAFKAIRAMAEKPEKITAELKVAIDRLSDLTK
jgi:Arc/MetJ-type ribon-helix-helix transcriptional regulator